MIREIPIARARDQLTTLPERLAAEDTAIAVTRRGRPVLAVMTWDLYESIVETLEILGDPELLSQLRRAVTDVDEGHLVEWTQVRGEFIQ
jgi:prevent-host-death family protein